jgi:hypothetical protein
MFFGRVMFGSDILGDIWEDNVGDEGPLVDTVSGLLNVPTGFLSVSNTMCASAISTESTSRLVEISDESIEVFSSWLVDEG